MQLEEHHPAWLCHTCTVWDDVLESLKKKQDLVSAIDEPLGIRVTLCGPSHQVILYLGLRDIHAGLKD